MAEPLKHFFDAARVEQLAAMLRAVHPAFPRARFVAEACDSLEALEHCSTGARCTWATWTCASLGP
jgi:hypothetical protein